LKYIYISEPAWFEEAVPSWIDKKFHTIITESDTVLTAAFHKKIPAYTLSSLVDSESSISMMNESINNASRIINFIRAELKSENYYSEILKGISDFIYEVNKKYKAIKKITNKKNISNITFIYGYNLLANTGTTPRGSYVEYLIFKNLCNKNKINFTTERHKLLSKKIINNSSRYDKTFVDTNYINIKKPIKKNKQLIKNKKLILVLYQYEMCKDDLYPLVEELNKENDVTILKAKLLKHAPESIKYNYAFLQSKKNINHKYLFDKQNFTRAVSKTFKMLSVLEIPDKHLKCQLLNFKKIKIFKSFKESYIAINELNLFLSSVKLDTVVITAYPGPISSVVSAFFLEKKINVLLRQHGGLAESFWPRKCYVEGCTFYSNSYFYKKNLHSLQIKSKILPRINTNVRIRANFSNSINILVLNNLFLNPTNKHLVEKFLQCFILQSPDNWTFTLRSHPRYPGYLLKNFGDKRLKFESSREISINESLKSSNFVICPVDTISSVISDSINSNIPVFLINPKGSHNIFDYQPFALGFPFIEQTPESLIKHINLIISNKDYYAKFIGKSSWWVCKILGQTKYIDPNRKIAKSMTNKTKKFVVTNSQYTLITIKLFFRNISNFIKL
jgi:hypothetical protein